MSNAVLNKLWRIAIPFFFSWGIFLQLYYFAQDDKYSVNAVGAAKYILATLFIAGSLSILAIAINFKELRVKPPKSLSIFIPVLGVVLLTVVLGIDWIRKTHNFLTPAGFRQYLILLFSIPTLFWFKQSWYFEFRNSLLETQASHTAISAVIITSLLWVVSPYQLYLREISALESSGSIEFQLYGRLLLCFTFGFVACFVFSYRSRITSILGIVLTSFALYLFAKMYLVNTIGLRIDVDRVVRLNESFSGFSAFKDFTLLFVIFVIAGFLVLHAKAKLISLMIFVLVLSYLGLYIDYSNAKNATLGADNSNAIPLARKMQLSETGLNQVVVFLDEYQGSLFHDLLESNAILGSEFDGFTYYPNSLSLGTMTIHSTAAIFGGGKYLPNKILQNDPTTNFLSEISEAYDEMLSSFQEADFDINIAAPIYHSCAKIEQKFDAYCQSSLSNWLAEEDREFKNKEGMLEDHNSYKRDFIISAIRLGPEIFNKYFASKLPGHSRDIAISKMSRHWLGFKDLGARFEIGAKNNTFSLVYSAATHSPFILNSKCEVDVENTSRENSTKCATLALIKFFQWLKEKAIYDNTMIVIFSDHGIKGASAKNSMVFGTGNTISESTIANRHILTLVKPVDSRGAMERSDVLVSARDYPGFICEIKRGCSFYKGNEGNSRTSLESFEIREFLDHLSNEKRYKIDKAYSITAPIFDPNNWKEKGGK